MRAVIFDLDGTLIDSAPDLAAAVNRLLLSRFLAPLALDAVKTMIGDGAKTLLDRAFAARGRAAAPADLADFLADYEANAVVETRPYPGMVEALAAMRAAGHRLGVCTNKPAAPTRKILTALGLDEFFSVVTGGDSTAYKKPDPRHLEAALAALGGGAAVMVGDHENDMAAARGLEMPAIWVNWGYGKAEGDYTAHQTGELPGLVFAIPPATPG